MGKIIVIRHGNRLDFLDKNWLEKHPEQLEKTNSPLSDCGIQQAVEVASYISKHYDVQKVFSSPYLRTLQTAEPISHKLNIPICVENCIAEGGSDVVGHKIPSFATHTYFDRFNINRNYKSVHNPAEEESFLETHARVLPFVSALEELAQNLEGDILVFTHAITKIALVRGLMRDVKLEVYVSTCSITEIEFDNSKDQRILHKLCLIDHLPNKGQFTWGLKPNSLEQIKIEERLPAIYEEHQRVKEQKPSQK